MQEHAGIWCGVLTISPFRSTIGTGIVVTSMVLRAWKLVDDTRHPASSVEPTRKGEEGVRGRRGATSMHDDGI